MQEARKKLKKVFAHMKDRCYNKNDKRYNDWGGRGITICKEWLENVELFVDWSIENGYQDGLTIDRINNDKGYYPDNCRWVTIAENNQNRRSCKYYTINGETKNLQQWCNIYNISRSMVNRRLQFGWDIEKALNTPKRTRDKKSLIGKRFERLTVIKFVGISKRRQSLYECLCDCGKTVVIDGNKLQTGHNRSCGCLKNEICYNRRV